MLVSERRGLRCKVLHGLCDLGEFGLKTCYCGENSAILQAPTAVTVGCTFSSPNNFSSRFFSFPLLFQIVWPVVGWPPAQCCCGVWTLCWQLPGIWGQRIVSVWLWPPSSSDWPQRASTAGPPTLCGDVTTSSDKQTHAAATGIYPHLKLYIILIRKKVHTYVSINNIINLLATFKVTISAMWYWLLKLW